MLVPLSLPALFFGRLAKVVGLGFRLALVSAYLVDPIRKQIMNVNKTNPKNTFDRRMIRHHENYLFGQ
jgi:hypothetical protein